MLMQIDGTFVFVVISFLIFLFIIKTIKQVYRRELGIHCQLLRAVRKHQLLWKVRLKEKMPVLIPSLLL